MKAEKREQYRRYVEQWKHAGPELERIRRAELRALDTRAEVSGMDALADIGLRFARPRETSGLVEMQWWFMKFARQQGLLPAVREAPATYGAADLHILGNAALPAGPKVALLCSVKCPGKVILDTYDLCQHLRDRGVIVVSGFHSPMEQECLRILLRSPHPVIWCLARGLIKTVPAACKPAVVAGRLVIVSPFADQVRRVTAQTAMFRNRAVADLAAAVIVPHAAHGSKMEALCRDLLAAGKCLYTFPHPANAALLQAGARPITPAIDWPAARHGTP